MAITDKSLKNLPFLTKKTSGQQKQITLKISNSLHDRLKEVQANLDNHNVKFEYQDALREKLESMISDAEKWIEAHSRVN
ncbi:hypothetical protein [Shewanella algae]|uniref:hypothetical protein n=1 Tax=Shewanella algae TaxID=38313 RepID=UPI0031F4F6A7